MKISHNRKGFTIVELLVATATFSVILLVVSAGLLQIGRVYFKAITQSRTQEVARAIIDDVSRAIQFSNISPAQVSSGSTQGWCIGQQRYSYLVDRLVTDSPVVHALVSDVPVGTCSTAQALDPTPATLLGKELLNSGMRLKIFRICAPGDVASCGAAAPPVNSGLYRITIRVVTGDNDLLDASQNNCSADLARGTQFCAVSELSTVVQKRL